MGQIKNIKLHIVTDIKKTVIRLTMESSQQQPKELPSIVTDAVLIESATMPEDAVTVEGYDFNQGIHYDKLLASMKRTGFQALHFGQAVEEINRMLQCRDQPLGEINQYIEDKLKPRTNCTIFLGYTSNMASAGVRDVVRFLVEHYLGDVKLKGSTLRSQGLNRIGNLIVPNSNYCLFEDWYQPILNEMLDEQREKGTNWTPCKMIHKMGEKIDNPKSIYYWAWKNNIPVFSPAITDGSIGDNIYFHSYRNPGLRIDIAEDITHINNLSVYAKNTGQLIIGGGLVKHHICNANLMRNGADFSVYLNTAHDFDGSDAGASPDEAISWGKIKASAKPVKVVADASITFPLIVAETFAKYHYNKKEC